MSLTFVHFSYFRSRLTTCNELEVTIPKMHVLWHTEPKYLSRPAIENEGGFQTYEWPVGEMKNKQQ